MRNGLSVENRGDLIIVTQPGTEFSATYMAARGVPGLILLSGTTDPNAEAEAINAETLPRLLRESGFPAKLEPVRQLGFSNGIRASHGAQ
jgi:hypothetical protein